MKEVLKKIGLFLAVIFILWLVFSSGKDSGSPSVSSFSYDEDRISELESELEDTQSQLQEAHDCIDQLHDQLDEIRRKASYAQDSDYDDMNDTLWNIESKARNPECGY